jgi:predicted polyphosphate/ATP-dependent NAD kinase
MQSSMLRSAILMLLSTILVHSASENDESSPSKLCGIATNMLDNNQVATIVLGPTNTLKNIVRLIKTSLTLALV